MAAAATDLLRKKESNFSTTLSSGVTDSATTIPLSSTTGLPTDTAITLTIDRVDSNGNSLNTTERITGVVSGNNIINSLRGEDGSTAQAHSSGAVVEDIWDSETWNDLIDALLVGHAQDGAHNFTQIEDSNGNETLKLSGVASAVNEITIENAATGANPKILATGEADTGITFENDQDEEILIIDAIASAVNEITISNAATGNPPSVAATGDNSNIDLELTPKGTGNVTAGGVDVATVSDTQTLTNKRITRRISTEASSATPTINTDNVDMHTITALATNITSFTTNLSGTPSNGDTLIIRIQDSGSGQTIAWGASFESAGATLPTSITAGKKAYIGLIYNSADSKWDCIAAVEEA